MCPLSAPLLSGPSPAGRNYGYTTTPAKVGPPSGLEPSPSPQQEYMQRQAPPPSPPGLYDQRQGPPPATPPDHYEQALGQQPMAGGGGPGAAYLDSPPLMHSPQPAAAAYHQQAPRGSAGQGFAPDSNVGQLPPLPPGSPPSPVPAASGDPYASGSYAPSAAAAAAPPYAASVASYAPSVAASYASGAAPYEPTAAAAASPYTSTAAPRAPAYADEYAYDDDDLGDLEVDENPAPLRMGGGASNDF
jgi:hypothetical protein